MKLTFCILHTLAPVTLSIFVPQLCLKIGNLDKFVTRGCCILNVCARTCLVLVHVIVNVVCEYDRFIYLFIGMHDIGHHIDIG